MSDNFRQRYGGSAGHILDMWAANRINQEIGELYEKYVFGQESIDVAEMLNEYHGGKTGGKIVYSEALTKEKQRGNITNG